MEEYSRHFLGLTCLAGSFDLSLVPVYREAALIAYHFHWSRTECFALSRRQRHAWLEEIKRINREVARAVKARRR